MSIRQGKKLIASSTTNGFNLFDCKWADHILNNISWLRADTFSWQSGDVYTAVYQHLVDDIDGNKTAQTDTIGDITITYFLSEDGHKICLPYRESDLVALYNKTGVAWYYILDTTNRQFKLPRTKWGFTGIRNGVGGYVAPGLPNITGTFQAGSGTYTAKFNNLTGAFGSSATGTGRDVDGGSSTATTIAKFDASKSNSIYGRSTTVQPPATQMYLYFYVGNFVEDITTIDAGKLAEVVNDFDIDTFKPQVDEAKNSAITGISDAKTDAIGSLTNLATDLGTSLKYGNVGDIFYTSRLDMSLNGAVECNGNLYNTTDFGGAQSIGNLLRDSKVPYISLTEHQTTVDTYGSCRCFGWDGGTEFRVPKLADVFIEAGVAASEGEFITAGLPNITGSFSTASDKNLGNGAFSWTTNKYATNGGGKGGQWGINFSAKKSNSIYGNSTTVQPPAVRYRAMVQLAFGATDDAVVTAGNVVADVSELNAHKVIAFQAPTSANNYTWYRKYADGWVEQGVAQRITGGGSVGVVLPVPMTDANYTILVSQNNSDGGGTYFQCQYHTPTATGFTVISQYGQSRTSRPFLWYVCGMAA